MASGLEIHVHQIGGHTERFHQSDPEQISAIFASIHPARVFTQPYITIHGDAGLYAYRAASVSRVDLIAETLPDWPFAQHAHRVDEVDPAEFRAGSDPEEFAAANRNSWNMPGEKPIGYTELYFADGAKLFWRVTMEALPLMAIDLTNMISGLLSTGGLHANRASGGVTIVNTSAVERAAFYPGPPAVSSKSWQAHRLAESAPKA